MIDPSLTSIEGPGLAGLVLVNNMTCFNVKTPSNMVVFAQLKAEVVGKKNAFLIALLNAVLNAAK